MDALRIVKCVVTPIVSLDDVRVLGKDDPFANKVFRVAFFIFSLVFVYPFFGALAVYLINKSINVLKGKEVPKKHQVKPKKESESSRIELREVLVCPALRRNYSFPSLEVSGDFKQHVLDYFRGASPRKWLHSLIQEARDLNKTIRGSYDASPWYLTNWKVLSLISHDGLAKANFAKLLNRPTVRMFINRGRNNVLKNIEFNRVTFGRELGFRAYCQSRGYSREQANALLATLKDPNIPPVLFFKYLLGTKEPK